MNCINLLPPPRRAGLRLRSRIRLWSIASALYAGLLCCGWGALAASGAHDGGSVAVKLAAATREAEKYRSEVGSLRKEGAAQARLLEAARAVRGHPDWSLLLSSIAQRRGDEIVLEKLELKPVFPTPAPGAKAPPEHAPSGFNFIAVGLARSQTAAAAFPRLLEEMRVFDSVAPAETRPRADRNEDKLIEFKVQGALTERPETRK